MTTDQALADEVRVELWATRGRDWGFRFLVDAGSGDPLPRHERAFAELASTGEVLSRRGGLLVVRFADPQGRSDRSGRPIPHELLLSGAIDSLDTVAGVQAAVWAELDDYFTAVWQDSSPPPSLSSLR